MLYNILSLPSSCSAIVLLLAYSQSASCLPGSLWPRTTTLPAPIGFTPDQNWEGIDGAWNTFALRVGTPEQTVRVVVSTASQQTWVIDPRGCPNDTPTNTSCADSRGTTFNYETSSSWKREGLYDLWIESNLGLSGNAEYGFDSVGLGYPGEGGVTLKNQVVGSLATTAFNFGHFGINPKPTNFTNLTSQSPSFMTTLKDQNLIPSVSWGYTAGVPYRFAKVLSSLTLGGYDSSRFIPNSVSFPFAADNERDLLVSIQSVTTGNNVVLLPNPVLSYLDSTVAEIWLPVEACVLFEKAFGITYDEDSELYMVPDNVHNQLILTNPNITFNVAPYTYTNVEKDIISIVLPYNAFDLQAKPPYMGINATTRYFPLRRATNQSEYTLGRTFFQEAYLTVDWERQNFSVSQCSWVNGAQQHIVAIKSLNSTGALTAGGATSEPSKPSSVSPGVIAGIVIGVVAILAITALIAFLHLRRKANRRAQAAAIKDEDVHSAKVIDAESNKGDEEHPPTLVFPKAELDANTPLRHEADNGFYKSDKEGLSAAGMVESDAKTREIHEMPGDMPVRQEADGAELSEKQAMRYREERINGVDPTTISPVSPASNPGVSPTSNDRSPTSITGSNTLPSTLNSSRRAMVSPGDVIEISPVENRTLLPVSPLDGSDGSRTMMFSPMSPIGNTGFSPINNGHSPITPGTDSSTDATRKRFSYED